MKKCPFCSEEIQDSAKKCRHCGEWIKGDNSNEVDIPKEDLIDEYSYLSLKNNKLKVSLKDESFFEIEPIKKFTFIEQLLVVLGFIFFVIFPAGIGNLGILINNLVGGAIGVYLNSVVLIIGGSFQVICSVLGLGLILYYSITLPINLIFFAIKIISKRIKK